MRILNTTNQAAEVRRVLTRRLGLAGAEGDELSRKVAAIIASVRQRGDQALLDFTAEFDRVKLSLAALRVQPQELAAAAAEVTPEFIGALSLAKENLLNFHSRQRVADWLDTQENGVVLGQRQQAIEAAGLYIPGGSGGTTPLVSSVLMNAVPALVAGVKRLIICSPPQADGRLNPHLLYAAQLCQIDEVYKVGGAQAIAAMAYGTATIAAVDLIVGPGNRYVSEAKRQVFGTVGIDLLAGPSEILIIADQPNNPEFIAADLLSQAEHGPVDEAGAFLLTPAADLAQAVAAAVDQQLQELPRPSIARASLEASGAIIITKDLAEAVELANYVAPEHLELLVADPWSLQSRIKHAGAIFIGPYSTEPIGDYVAGTNHVLPTSGTARFASGLNLSHFLKKISIVAYNQAGIIKSGQAAITLAEVEGMAAHAQAVKLRWDAIKNSDEHR